MLRDAANREDKHRVRLLDEIAPFLGKDSFLEVFALVATIADSLRSDALPSLTDTEVEWKSDEDERDDDFPDPYAIERPRSLEQARAITFDLERVAGLVLVASSLEGAQRRGVLEEAFAEALRINDRQRRQQAFWIVARGLKEIPRERLVELCLEAVRKGASQSRFELVSDLVALRPTLESVDAVSTSMTPALVGEIASWLL